MSIGPLVKFEAESENLWIEQRQNVQAFFHDLHKVTSEKETAYKLILVFHDVIYNQSDRANLVAF